MEGRTRARELWLRFLLMMETFMEKRDGVGTLFVWIYICWSVGLFYPIIHLTR